MCHDSKSLPPFPAERRGGAQVGDMVITAGDGNRFAAFVAQPEQPVGAQVLMLPDVRGLHQYFKDLATLFAEAGVAALAWDYFGRSAGLTQRDNAFEFMPHVQLMSPDRRSAASIVNRPSRPIRRP